MNPSRVLVTGAAGFIGSHVCAHYAAQGFEVIGLARPSSTTPSDGLVVEETSRWPEIIASVAPGIVFHCAGSASVPRSLNDPLSDFASGPALTAALLDAIRCSVPEAAFVFISSAAVYGEPAALPITESTPPNPLSPYGYHKLQSELSCEAYAKVFGLKTVSARVFSAYGPGLCRQVVWDLLQKAQGGAFCLRGAGDESRDFIHIDDVVRALATIASSAPFKGEVFNVACGEEVPIAELATLVTAALGREDTQVTFDGHTTPNMPVRWCADISRLLSLGFTPQVTLKDGVVGMAAFQERSAIG